MSLSLRLEAEPGEDGQHPALGTGRVWGKEEEPEKRGKVFRKLILILADKVCRSGSSSLWSPCTPTSRSRLAGDILKSVVARVSVQYMRGWPQQSLTRDATCFVNGAGTARWGWSALSTGDGESVRESKGDVTVILRLTVSSQSEAYVANYQPIRGQENDVSSSVRNLVSRSTLRRYFLLESTLVIGHYCYCCHCWLRSHWGWTPSWPQCWP